MIDSNFFFHFFILGFLTNLSKYLKSLRVEQQHNRPSTSLSNLEGERERERLALHTTREAPSRGNQERVRPGGCDVCPRWLSGKPLWLLLLVVEKCSRPLPWTLYASYSIFLQLSKMKFHSRAQFSPKRTLAFRVPEQNLYAFPISVMRTVCPVYSIPLQLSVMIILTLVPLIMAPVKPSKNGMHLE
jgi:hypothetical protein